MRKITLSLLAAVLSLIATLAVAQQTGIPISQLPRAATPLAGTEVIPLVQGGFTRQVPVSALPGCLMLGCTTNSLTPHAVLVGNGPNVFHLATIGTAGRLLVDQGPNLDPLFVIMSGDGMLAADGTFRLLASGVTAGTYGDGTHSTQVTFDAKGRATSASSVTITHASGDLAAANNLSDLANASAARTNLGTAPGTGLSTDGAHLNLQPAQNATIGGVEAIPSASHQWIAYIDTSGVPHQSQPSFADISGSLNLSTQVSGTLGVSNSGTGATSFTANAILKGNGTSPISPSLCSDTGSQFVCGESLGTSSFALLSTFTAHATINPGQIVKLDASGEVIPVTTSDVDGAIGIAHGGAASGQQPPVAISAQQTCIFDGATTSGDWVTISSTVAGDCHDTGSAIRATGQQQIGQVLSTNAAAGSYAINIENQYTPAGGSGGTTPASNVTYTPPGTGGVATNANAMLQQYAISPVNYGAKCDGSTDDSAAFQAAINQSESASIPLTFPGPCYIASSLNVTASLSIMGYGTSYSILKVPAGIKKLFNVTTTARLNFQHFTIQGPATPTAGDTGILVNPATGENSLSYFNDVYINNLWHGINFTCASQWKILNSNINVYGGDGVLIANANNVDSGDSTIQGTQILCNDSSGCGGAVYYQSSGGLRFVNDKVNANGGNFTYGVWLSLANGANTGVLIVDGGSIENVTDGVYFSRAGTTGTFQRVNIVGTEFLVTGYGLLEPTDTNGSWLTGVTASNIVVNLTSASATNAFNFATTVNGLQIGPATVINSGSSSSSKVSIGGTQTSSNCAIGPIVGSGTFAASGLGSCTSIAPN